jgi:hypothetical protein
LSHEVLARIEKWLAIVITAMAATVTHVRTLILNLRPRGVARGVVNN